MTQDVFRSADLLVRSALDFGSNTCVITFDSYTDERKLDRFGFGEAFFQSRSIDAIHFISRENDWYQYPEMPEVAARVADLVKGYGRVVTYGSSMGAYAAIRFGGLVGAATALAISPQFSIDPRRAKFEQRWKNDSDRIDFILERKLKAPFVSTAYVVYDPHDADKRHADLFRQHTRVIDVPLPDVGHPATGPIAEAGLLSDLLEDFVADRLDIDRLAQQMLAARETSPHFHYVMSMRAQTLASQIAHAGRAAAMAPGQLGFVAHHASLLALADRFAEAHIAFARAAAIAPDHPVLLNKLIEFHERRGDWDGAIETAERLVQLHSESFRPRLEQLRLARQRRSKRPRWRVLTLFGRHSAGDPSLPLDVRVTTTPSPPPFVESWRRHEALMVTRPSGAFDLFLVGDSLVEFWPEDLWAPLRIFNFGVRADKTQHALWRLEQLPAGSVECSHAVILLGANNLGADDTADGIAAGVAAVVAGVVRVAPKAKVWAIATPPCGADLQFRAEVRLRANQMLAAFESFETVNVDAALTESGDALSYDPDGIHFSRAGYERLTSSVIERLG
jgi:tetratricopeptide (TPR) repeat protein